MPLGPAVQTDVLMNGLNAIVGNAYRRHYDAGTNVVKIVLSDSSEAKDALAERHMDYLEFVEIERLAQERTDARLALIVPVNPVIPLNPVPVNPVIPVNP